MVLYIQKPNREKVSPIVLLTIALTFLTSTAVVVRVRTASLTGYELSIYDVLIPYFVVPIAISYVALYILALQNAFKQRVLSTEFASLLGAIMFLNATMYALPAIRGYYRYGPVDEAAAIGDINTIISTGQIPQELVYPIGHLLASAVHFGTDLPVPSVLFLSIFVMSLIPLYHFLLAYSLFENESLVGLTTLSGTVPLFAHYHVYALFDPMALSLVFTPLIFYIMFKSFKMKNRFLTLFLLFCVVMAPFHTVTSIVLSMSFIASGALLMILRRINPVMVRFSISRAVWILYIGAATNMVSMLLWLTYGPFLREQLLVARAHFTGELASTDPDQNVNALMNFDPFTLIELIVKLLGPPLLFIALAGVGLYFAYRSRHQLSVFGQFLLIGVWIAINGATGVIHAITRIFPLYLDRFVDPMVILAPPLATVALDFLSRSRKRRVLILLFFIVVVGLSIPAVHPSPYVEKPNAQVTEAELESGEWMSSYATSNTEYKSIEMRPYALVDMTGGTEYRRAHDAFREQDYLVESHLGYTDDASHTSLPEGTVVVITDRDKWMLNREIGLGASYTENDYKQFQQDTLVNKHYNNGGVLMYYVKSDTSDHSDRMQEQND